MALYRAVALVHAEEAPAKVDADALRAGRGGALDEGGIVQRRAGLGVHVAGDQAHAALRVAELGLHLLEGVERRVADPEIAHVEIAQAEVEYLMEELIVAGDLGVFGGAEIGKDAVLAEHQEQGLVGARAVGAAGEAVDRPGARRLRGIGPGSGAMALMTRPPTTVMAAPIAAWPSRLEVISGGTKTEATITASCNRTRSGFLSPPSPASARSVTICPSRSRVSPRPRAAPAGRRCRR